MEKNLENFKLGFFYGIIERTMRNDSGKISLLEIIKESGIVDKTFRKEIINKTFSKEEENIIEKICMHEYYNMHKKIMLQGLSLEQALDETIKEIEFVLKELTS